jgi:hypothetical protein
MPIHNEDATIANLARNTLTMANGEFTLIQTETLRLLMNKLIEKCESKNAMIVEETQDRTVRQFIARVQTAERDRDEDDQQRRGGGDAPSAKRRSWS